MDWLNIIAVSVSMAVDCMTIGAVDGIKEPQMKKRKISFIAFIFGLMQGLTPMLGYFFGYLFRKQLEAYIPWVAFGLLTALAIKNIVEFILDHTKKGKEEEKEENEEKKVITIPDILLQGVATSIDALAIGFVYLDYDIPKAMIVFAMIGVITFGLSLLTIFLGKKVGKWLENWAGLIAGIVFLLIGLRILLSSLLSPGDATSLLSILWF